MRSAAAALLALAALAAPASAAGLPPQGVYEQCQPASRACRAHLNDIAAAGFRLVLNYRSWEASPRQLRAYADKAGRLGLELILPLNHPVWRARGRAAGVYPALAHACRCRRSSRLLRYALHLADRLPAVWGWYVGDQLPAREAPRVRRLTAVVRGIDPKRPRLYISYRGAGPTLYPLAPFAATADVLGLAAYPVGLGSPLATVGHAVSVSRRVAGGTATVAAVLQAFDWLRYGVTRRSRWPTVTQMRTMRDLAIAAGANLLLWYSWQDVLSARDPSRRADLVAAAFAP